MKRIVFILFLLVFIFSCGEKRAKDDKGIFITTGGEVATIDPHKNTASAGSVYILHAFEGLTRKNKKNEIVGGIADKWTVSDDGLTYTFNIRKDAKWSDGKTITANDFVYSFRRVADPKTAAPQSTLMAPVKNSKKIVRGQMPVESLGIRAIDDSTLEIILENPTSYFLEFIASTGIFMPVRQDIIETHGDKWVHSPETYITSGPYMMTERKPDEYIVLETNPNYHAKNELVAKKITVVFVSDSLTAMAGIQNGDIHFSTRFPSGDTEKLKTEGLIVPTEAYGTIFYEMNLTNEALKDPRVRRAIALAIDRNYIIENVTKEGQRPAGSFVPPLISDYEGEFRKNGGEQIDVSKENQSKNVEEAKRLMAEAGYPGGKGYPIIELLDTAGNNLRSEAVQQMLKEIGIDVVIVTKEWAAILQAFRDRSYQIVGSSWTGDYNDPMTMLDLYLSYMPSNPGYSNKEYDELIEFAQKSPDKKARMEAMHKAEDILMKDMPIITLYYRKNFLLVRPELKGYILDPLAKHRFHYSYLEQK